MKRYLLALLLLPVLLLTGCAEDKLQGEVTNKQVDPGYTWIYMQPIYSERCSPSGTRTVCSSYQSGSIPIVMETPTCYRIFVTGKTSGDTCIDQDRWNRLNIGDRYIGKDVSQKDMSRKKH